MKTIFNNKVIKSIALVIFFIFSVTIFDGCSSERKIRKVESTGRMGGFKK